MTVSARAAKLPLRRGNGAGPTTGSPARCMTGRPFLSPMPTGDNPLLDRGQADAAIEKFKIANQKAPHFADPLEGWGEALMAKNQSHLALEKFTEAEKYAPNWGRLHLKWGEALAYAGKRDQARAQFARAAALDLSPSEKSELSRWGVCPWLKSKISAHVLSRRAPCSMAAPPAGNARRQAAPPRRANAGANNIIFFLADDHGRRGHRLLWRAADRGTPAIDSHRRQRPPAPPRPMPTRQCARLRAWASITGRYQYRLTIGPGGAAHDPPDCRACRRNSRPCRRLLNAGYATHPGRQMASGFSCPKYWPTEKRL